MKKGTAKISKRVFEDDNDNFKEFDSEKSDEIEGHFYMEFA